MAAKTATTAALRAVVGAGRAAPLMAVLSGLRGHGVGARVARGLWGKWGDTCYYTVTTVKAKVGPLGGQGKGREERAHRAGGAHARRRRRAKSGASRRGAVRRGVLPPSSPR
jgi:hypothetical protein